MSVQTAHTVQSEIIEAISEAAEIDSIGLLSPASDLTVSFAGGKQTKKYLDGSGLYKMSLRILGKGTDQLALADRLCGICEKLSQKDPRTFPKTDEWEIRSVSVISSPALDEQSGNGTWYYICEISVIYFSRSKEHI